MERIKATKRDSRYTVTLEWVGYKVQRHVARYCGEMIAHAATQAEAWTIAADHSEERVSALCMA